MGQRQTRSERNMRRFKLHTCSTRVENEQSWHPIGSHSTHCCCNRTQRSQAGRYSMPFCYTQMCTDLQTLLSRPHDFITRLDARASTLSRSELCPLKCRSQLQRRNSAVRAMRNTVALCSKSLAAFFPRVEQTLFRLEPSPQQTESTSEEAQPRSTDFRHDSADQVARISHCQQK